MNGTITREHAQAIRLMQNRVSLKDFVIGDELYWIEEKEVWILDEIDLESGNGLTCSRKCESHGLFLSVEDVLLYSKEIEMVDLQFQYEYHEKQINTIKYKMSHLRLFNKTP